MFKAADTFEGHGGCSCDASGFAVFRFGFVSPEMNPFRAVFEIATANRGEEVAARPKLVPDKLLRIALDGRAEREQETWPPGNKLWLGRSRSR